MARIVAARLTRTEMRVLKAILEFKSNKEIAVEMGVEERTVKFHAVNIYAKCGGHCRADIFRAALRQKFLVPALMLALFALAPAALRAARDSRTYHPIAIAKMAAENPARWNGLHTHVKVTGFVTYEKREGDGDLHIRICDAAGIKGMDRKNCIVAECIPELPCSEPEIGDEITVKGISRFDAERPGHNWWEVHPVENLVAPGVN